MTVEQLAKPDLNYLAHFGVLGMKWGVRKDRDSASVRKAKENLSTAKKELHTATTKKNLEAFWNGALFVSPETKKRFNDASREYKYSKKDLASLKILEKLSKKEKSKSQLAMEEKYKAKGMTADEAAVAAYQNIRTKKILATVGGITIAAAASYAVYKYRDENVDKILKSGTKLQNISADSTSGIRDAFYSSTNKLDNIKYRGLYGSTIKEGGRNAFQKEIKTLSDIKQASGKSAQNALSELMKTDSEFASGVKNYISPKKSLLGDRYSAKVAKAATSLKNGVVDKNVYEVFNATLVDHSPEMQTLTDKFFNKLSEKGYNAIKDVNDSKYSGYEAINPIIAFNTKGKVDVVNVKALVNDEVNKAKSIGLAQILGSAAVKTGAKVTTAVLLGNIAKQTVSSLSSQKKVSAYRQEHPETKLTNTEIERMLERNK